MTRAQHRRNLSGLSFDGIVTNRPLQLAVCVFGPVSVGKSNSNATENGITTGQSPVHIAKSFSGRKAAWKLTGGRDKGGHRKRLLHAWSTTGEYGMNTACARGKFLTVRDKRHSQQPDSLIALQPLQPCVLHLRQVRAYDCVASEM